MLHLVSDLLSSVTVNINMIFGPWSHYSRGVNNYPATSGSFLRQGRKQFVWKMKESRNHVKGDHRYPDSDFHLGNME